MANIKSAKKRAKTSEVRRRRNIARRSEIKTVTKKVLEALANDNIDDAKKLLRTVESKIARAKGKGVFKKNTASRKVSLLAKKVSAAQQPKK